jgi:hypothetical protein
MGNAQRTGKNDPTEARSPVSFGLGRDIQIDLSTHVCKKTLACSFRDRQFDGLEVWCACQLDDCAGPRGTRKLFRLLCTRGS